ncbi:hypothetical protein ColTof4_01318 [Colletotrichum tofieldiae]|nr:hypothetical protein ColTof3_08570 [Colletotrichum tofieldiae]GKT68895.1 hypothetical protein ColTof4_01318 [Colletotrichum tofieldiae]
MALTQQTPTPQAWGRWQQQPAGHDYGMMDNSTFVQYDSRAATYAPMNGAIMAPQYVVGHQYNMMSMPAAMGHHCPTQNHFAYAHETKMSNLKTLHPLNTKDITFNKPTTADPVNFTTAIDTLMKAIQKRHDSADIIKGVPETEQVKPEPWSPICSKVFAQRGNLHTHMATHTNAKPFVCKLDDCSKMFTQRGNFKNHQNKYHEKTLMEMTDWIVSISDIDALSDDQREMYWYFANLYKNSNKGIKGRGKDRRVSNRGSKSRAAPSSYSVKRVPGPTSLAAYSSKRLPTPEQYMQHHQHGYEVYDTDIDQSSSASSPRNDGLPVSYRDRIYQQSTHAMY